MIRYEIAERVRRPTAEVYDFVVEHQPENHPRWEPEVLELRRMGPAATGTRGVMVRKDFGRVTENAMEWVEIVPGRLMRERSDGNGVVFDMTFEMIPQGNETDLKVSVEVTLSGFMWLMQPLMGRVFKKSSAQIMKRLVGVLEEAR